MAKPTRVPVALVGGETLLGRDVRELLEKAPFVGEVTQYSVGVAKKQRVGEPEVMPPLSAANLKTTPVVVLAGAESGDLSKQKGKTIVDVCGVLEDHPEARLRAPLVEERAGNPLQVDKLAPSAGGPQKGMKPLLPVSIGNRTRVDNLPHKPGIQVIAHPAAIALALILKEVHRISPIRRSVVLIFEPASERGQAGIEELQKQTVGLLSFKKLPQEIYDAQLTFNLLPRYGEDAPLRLEDIELKIERHLATLLAAAEGTIPMPSLRLVQASVFHGYSLSLWVEFENNPGADALSAGLTAARIDVRTEDHEPPTSAGVTGQSGITAGAISKDRNCASACWLWVVADNFKLAAENALEVVREAVE